jgi:hypothetical protein
MAFFIWDTGLAQCNNSLPWFSLFKSQNHPANLSPWPGCKAESQNKKRFTLSCPFPVSARSRRMSSIKPTHCKPHLAPLVHPISTRVDLIPGTTRHRCFETWFMIRFLTRRSIPIFQPVLSGSGPDANCSGPAWMISGRPLKEESECG